MQKKNIEIREDDGYIMVDGTSWENWTVARLLDLTDELEEVRCGSWQLVQLAPDAAARKRAMDVYSTDLKREVLAYRAIGFLHQRLEPTPRRTRARQGASLSWRGDDEEAARAEVRREFVIGCRLAGICPDGWELHDPDGHTPRG